MGRYPQTSSGWLVRRRTNSIFLLNDDGEHFVIGPSDDIGYLEHVLRALTGTMGLFAELRLSIFFTRVLFRPCS
jgi:hypothetical protein